MSAEPVYQREALAESPAIHVVLGPGVDPRLFRWVEVGAEEEGVPCRLAPAGVQGLVAAAYDAAQASRLGVGVGVGADKVLLHEAHMPAGQPVWEWRSDGTPAEVCRMAGSNAGRFVKRMPLRLEAVAPPSGGPPAPIQPGKASGALVQAIARVLERRGLV